VLIKSRTTDAITDRPEMTSYQMKHLKNAEGAASAAPSLQRIPNYLPRASDIA
jgi:hypothetical protein